MDERLFMKSMCCVIVVLTVFYLRIGSYLPIWVSDPKMNLLGWKITCLDFVIALVCVNNFP